MTFYGLVGYYHPTGASIEADAMYVAAILPMARIPKRKMPCERCHPFLYDLNLRLNYAPPKAKWAIFAGVRNLTDESFIAQRTTGSFIGIQPGEIGTSMAGSPEF